MSELTQEQERFIWRAGLKSESGGFISFDRFLTYPGDSIEKFAKIYIKDNITADDSVPKQVTHLITIRLLYELTIQDIIATKCFPIEVQKGKKTDTFIDAEVGEHEDLYILRIMDNKGRKLKTAIITPPDYYKRYEQEDINTRN